MAIEIRPPAEDELRAAMDGGARSRSAPAHVEDEDWERESKALPARARARRVRRRPAGRASPARTSST